MTSLLHTCLDHTAVASGVNLFRSEKKFQVDSVDFDEFLNERFIQCFVDDVLMIF